MRKLYLAGPYSHPEESVRHERFVKLNVLSGLLMAQGNIVFSPISMTHPIATMCDLPLGFDFWEAQDRAFIEWCDALYVAMLPGWDESVGVEKEVRIAKEMGKPVDFLKVPS